MDRNQWSNYLKEVWRKVGEGKEPQEFLPNVCFVGANPSDDEKIQTNSQYYALEPDEFGVVYYDAGALNGGVWNGFLITNKRIHVHSFHFTEDEDLVEFSEIKDIRIIEKTVQMFLTPYVFFTSKNEQLKKLIETIANEQCSMSGTGESVSEARKCPNCGSVNKGVDDFCGDCGAALPKLQSIKQETFVYPIPTPKGKAIELKYVTGHGGKISGKIIGTTVIIVGKKMFFNKQRYREKRSLGKRKNVLQSFIKQTSIDVNDINEIVLTKKYIVIPKIDKILYIIAAIVGALIHPSIGIALPLSLIGLEIFDNGLSHYFVELKHSKGVFKFKFRGETATEGKKLVDYIIKNNPNLLVEGKL